MASLMSDLSEVQLKENSDKVFKSTDGTIFTNTSQ